MSLFQDVYVHDDLDDTSDYADKPTVFYDLSSVERPSYFCYGTQDRAPGLIMLDPEESSFSSCGTEEFFDVQDISSSLNLWQNLRRRVRFSFAHVQEYAITVGDHPICRDGLALSLDWNHSKEQVYDIDDFEFNRRRKNHKRGIRRRRVSKLDYFQRREILNRVGSYSNSDLSRIECERNKQAVSDFLLDAGSDDFGPSQEEFGIEQVYHSPSDSLSGMNKEFDFQMKIQILE